MEPLQRRRNDYQSRRVSCFLLVVCNENHIAIVAATLVASQPPPLPEERSSRLRVTGRPRVYRIIASSSHLDHACVMQHDARM